jgi:hypothetical protein
MMPREAPDLIAKLRDGETPEGYSLGTRHANVPVVVRLRRV